MKCHSRAKHLFSQESKLHSIFPSSEVTYSQAGKRELQGNFKAILNKFLKHFKKITVIY